VDLFQRIKTTLRYKSAAYPHVFIPACRLFAPPRTGSLLIAPDTEIVIEGFPRSGNTFAVAAFQQAQKRQIKIAHHLHAEAQILEGVKRSLPAIVLIREPLAAIRSLKIRQPELAVEEAFRRYIRFYSITRRVLKHIVVAKFEDVVEDFGTIIERVNHKFLTDFDIFDPTTANVDRVFREIERINLELFDGKETHVSRPSHERSIQADKFPMDYSKALAEKAQALYESICLESRG
jgi:hypothetical protein